VEARPEFEPVRRSVRLKEKRDRTGYGEMALRTTWLEPPSEGIEPTRQSALLEMPCQSEAGGIGLGEPRGDISGGLANHALTQNTRRKRETPHQTKDKSYTWH